MIEDDAPRPRPVGEVGQPLDLLSVAELEERIAVLQAEIARLEQARDAKRAANAAAEAFFRK
ncbi:hypothetical protein AMST5_02919 [freshwater sediment metagenome]|jgi:uncharacterized small protein (DUF1192 family)|uniref:DUF1192 domain-containing protein n=1 Tax=freshwater sediment metagenome TaxID=556182 RepID=A0AA48M2V3_9ZZZZ